MTESAGVNILEAAAANRQRAASECGPAIVLWADGIDALIRGLAPLRGKPFQHPGEDQEPVLFGLMAQAVNHQLAMYSLTLDGYYLEALCLVRSCVERWMSCLYVIDFPETAGRFLRSTSKDTPEWSEMLRKFERGTRNVELRTWWDWLNQLAHVDKATLGLMWEQVEGGEPLIRFGPIFDRRMLENCVGEASAVSPHLLQITDQMCKQYGVEPAEQGLAEAYTTRLETWMKALEWQRHGDQTAR